MLGPHKSMGPRSLTPFILPAVVALISIAIAAMGDAATQVTQFDRSAIHSGEVWRLLSGHFAHLGTSHLLLNLAGLALISLLFAPVMPPLAWAGCFLVSALFVSGGLYFFLPKLNWYVGLSGVLHGLFVTGAVASWRRGLRLEGLLLLALAVKLVWEQITGPLPGSESAAGGPVVVDAHLYGAIGGLVFSLAEWAYKKKFDGGGSARDKPEAEDDSGGTSR